MPLVIGYGDEGTGSEFTHQEPFPATTDCAKCGKVARMALTVSERNGGRSVCDVHPGDGMFWPHDLATFAIYLCTDFRCATATTRWNQG